MADAANRDGAARHSWAVPGSRHDRIVRLAKVALPSAVGVLVAILAVVPLEKNGDVSFILDKNKVANAPERMRVDTARYVGEDNRGRAFTIAANSAVQPSSDRPVVDISGMMARLALADGPVTVIADRAQYDLDTQKAVVVGPVKITGPDDYALATHDVTLDLKQRQVTGSGAIQGRMRLGEFSAGRMRADLGTRTIVLDQGARLKITQGAVR